MRVPVSVSAFMISLIALGCTMGSAHAEIEYDAVLTTDALDNISGGVNKGGRVMSNLDLSATWTGNDGWDGFAYVLADAGGGFTERYKGDVQTVSNIDAPHGVRLFEAWVRKTANSGRWSMTGGLINLNGMFDVQEAGALFLNASHGIGPDYSQSGPSIFPFSALGVVGEWRAHETLRLRVGVFDGVAGDPLHQSSFIAVKLNRDDGVHVVAEGEQDFKHGYLKFGGWTYTAKSQRLEGNGLVGNNSGYYAQVKYDFYRPEPESDRGVSGWIRAGKANQDIQSIESYVGGGLVWTGPSAGRVSDVIGLAVGQANFGRPYAVAAGIDSKPETTWELSYRYAIRDGLGVQPDVQYIRHPSGDPQVDDALVVGARIRVGLAAFK